MKYLEGLVQVNSLLNTKIFELERELIKTKEEIKKKIGGVVNIEHLNKDKS